MSRALPLIGAIFRDTIQPSQRHLSFGAADNRLQRQRPDLFRPRSCKELSANAAIEAGWRKNRKPPWVTPGGGEAVDTLKAR